VSIYPTLAEIPGGTSGVIAQITLAEGPRRRLAELGLRERVTVHLRQHTSGRGVVVDVGGSRIALDRATARAIAVTAND
jgi:Fe2+ transport system protein FeoA